MHDPQGLESVKAAIEKFNKESNQASYFKLLEVGRLSTQVGTVYLDESQAWHSMYMYMFYSVSLDGKMKYLTPFFSLYSAFCCLPLQHNMKFGMSNFAEFAIVETECSDNVKNEEKPACKQKCPNEAVRTLIPLKSFSLYT